MSSLSVFILAQWQRFQAESQLGDALLGQEQLTAAEPLLLAGYFYFGNSRGLAFGCWQKRLKRGGMVPVGLLRWARRNDTPAF